MDLYRRNAEHGNEARLAAEITKAQTLTTAFFDRTLAWLQDEEDLDPADSPRAFESRLSALNQPDQALGTTDTLLSVTPEIAAIFLNELIVYVQRLKDRRADHDLVSNFCAEIHNMFFSSSPNIFSSIPTDEKLLWIARATRHSELQGYVSRSLIGEINYDAGFTNEGFIEKVLFKIKQQSPATQMDLLHTLEAVGADVAGSASTYQREASAKIRTLIERIEDESELVLVTLAAHVAGQRLKHEQAHPTFGEIGLTSERGRGRLPTHHLDNGRIDPTVLSNEESLNANEYLRLISSDFIGVYDQSGRLDRIGEINKKGVRTAALERVFQNDPRILPFDQNELGPDDAVLLGQLQRPELRTFIEQQIEMPLADISLRGELCLLRFLTSKNKTAFEKLRHIVQKSSLDIKAFLETFFAAAEKPEYAQKILAFAETSDVAVANTVFAKYHELTAVVSDIEKTTAGFFDDPSKNTRVDTRRMVGSIVHKANESLLATMHNDEATREKGLNTLQAISADAQTFDVFCKEVFKNRRDTTFGEVRQLRYETVPGFALSEADKNAMMEITQETRASRPIVIERMKKLLFPSDQTGIDRLAACKFKLLKKVSGQQPGSGSEIFAFYFIEPRGPGHLFAGGLNVRENKQSAGFGDHLMAAGIQEYHRNHTIDITAVPELPALSMYIDQAGFEALGYEIDPESTGNTYGWLVLQLPKEQGSSQLRGINLKHAEATEVDISMINDDTKVHIVHAQASTPDELRALARELHRILTSTNLRLTRCVNVDKNGEKRIFGFEPKI